MTGNGVMVNATQMAKPFEKRPIDYLRLPSTNELIKAIVRKSHIAENQLAITERGGMHPGTHEFVEVLAKARGINPIAGKRTSLNASSLSDRYPQLIKAIRGWISGTVQQGTWMHKDVALEFARLNEIRNFSSTDLLIVTRNRDFNQ